MICRKMRLNHIFQLLFICIHVMGFMAKGVVMNRGEFVSEESGVLYLVWDNTYSLITSRTIHLRIAVKRR